MSRTVGSLFKIKMGNLSTRRQYQQPQAYGCNQYIQNDEAEVQRLDGRHFKK